MGDNRNIYNINRSKGVNGNETKQTVFNYEDNIPDMNMRNIHNSQRIGGLNNENKQIAFNYEDNIPEMNMRNIHSTSRNKGGASNENKQIVRLSEILKSP